MNPPRDAPRPRPGRRWWGLLIAAVVLGGGAWLVGSRSGDIVAAVERLSLGRFVLSGLLAVAGTVLVQLVWLALLRDLGARPGAGQAASVFFVSQLGKYLPGSVWSVVAQMEFGRRWGAPRAVMFAANVLLLGAVTATGIAVGAALLPWTSSGGLQEDWWLLLLLIPLLAGLHPRSVPALLDLLLRRLGREPVGARLSVRGLAAAAGWSLATWVALGLHLAVLLGAYADLGPREVAACVGGIGLAWAAGIAFVPAPAGAGVRDSVIVLTLAPIVGTSPALTIALASRLLLLVADVGLAALGVLGRRQLSAA